MMLDKKQILAIFLFEFKMGYKAVETTCNISNTPSSGTANEHTVHWQCRKFCMESLQTLEVSSGLRGTLSLCGV